MKIPCGFMYVPATFHTLLYCRLVYDAVQSVTSAPIFLKTRCGNAEYHKKSLVLKSILF